MELPDSITPKGLFDSGFSWLLGGGLIAAVAGVALKMLSKRTGKDTDSWYDFLPEGIKKFVKPISDWINNLLEKAADWLAGLFGIKDKPADAKPEASPSAPTKTDPEVTTPNVPQKAPAKGKDTPARAH